MSQHRQHHSGRPTACFAASARWIKRVAGRTALLVLLSAVLLRADLSRADEGNRRYPGKFVWFELVTNDLAAEEAFYGAVFGWHFRVVGSAPGSYTLIENGGDEIGGMFFHAPPTAASNSARWLSLISVPDPAQTVRYVEQHGGSVIAPLTTIVGHGTRALFRDPQGAVFGVLLSPTGDRPDAPVETGDFFWADLLARDPQQAIEFYSGLAGYEVSFREVNATMKRAVLAAEGYARAGIVPLPPAVKQPGWLAYVLVDDIPGILAKATAAGGHVLVQPRADLLGGNLAVVADPRGGVLGVVDWSAATGGDDTENAGEGAK